MAIGVLEQRTSPKNVDFLRTLYREAQGLLTLCVRKPAEHGIRVVGFYDVEETDRLVDDAMKFSGSAHVYHGLHPLRSKPSSGRGKKSDVLGAAFFAADIDAKDFIDDPAERERAKNLKDGYEWDPGLLKDSKSRALTGIREFPLAPSAIVDSGHGFYAYYQLSEFWRFSGPADVGRYEALNRRLHEALGGDSTHDVTRVLRVVGTVNVKPGCPMPCELVELDPEMRYGLDELQAVLVADRAKRETTSESVATRSEHVGESEGLRIVDKLRLPPHIRHMVITGDYGVATYPSRSERDMAIVHHLVENGLSDEEIHTVFESYPCGDKYREEGSNGSQYLDRTIRKARSGLGNKRALVIPPNFPPRSLGGNDLLVVTEGEAEAAAVCKAGLACVATTGFWEAAVARGRGGTCGGVVEWPEGLGQIATRGREFVLVYDSTIDQAHPAWVAYAALAELLYASGALTVRVLTVPAVMHAGKTTLCDYIRAKGIDWFLKLVDETPVWVPTGAGAKGWACERVSEAVERIDAARSPEAAYARETICALAALKIVNELEFARAKDTLAYKAKVSRRALNKAVEDEIKQIRDRQDAKPLYAVQRVCEVLPGAPVAQEARVPEGWSIVPEGVFRLTPGGAEKIAVAPLIMSERFVSMQDHTERVKLSCVRDGMWHEHTVDRAVIANTRRIVELANWGFPVTSSNDREVVDYLADYEATNIDYLGVSRVTTHLGWQGTGFGEGFLWGRKLIGGQGVVFQGADAGDEQIADGFHASGTYEEWVAAAKTVCSYPRVLFCLYAAFVPPMLPILNCPNFIVDLSGRTSRGKTTALRLVASVWGKPDEQAPDGAMASWDSTSVRIERALSVLQNLPLILDDTKRAKQDGLVAKTLYAAASGQGRGRGSKVGLDRTGHWRTVLFSSGEARAVSFTNDEGTRARTITLWGAPFGELSQEAGKALVDGLTAQIQLSYGHAGPRFLEWVINNREKSPEWREMYKERVQHFTRLMSGSRVSGRIASYLAAISLTAELAHKALALPWEFADPTEQVASDIAAELDDADMAAKALTVVYGWAQASRDTFISNIKASSSKQPGGGWAGRWDAGDDWQYIAFYPHALRRALADCGFDRESDYDAILAAWRDSGYLDIDRNSNKTAKSIWMGRDKGTARMIVIQRKAIDSLST